jgi:asparagine synthase (glutamine-hydrolysing)
MPGIAGILSVDPLAAARLDRMVGALAHDTAYTCGQVSNVDAGVHVGWAMHRGSFADCMPIYNETRDVVMFFCGEVYADAQQLHRLAGGRYRFDKDKAGYLVHLYEEQGEHFVNELNGSFCGLLVDRRRGVGLLFNDRYGATRLYLHHADDGLYFASEAKALLRVFAQTRQLDPSAVAQTFSLGCVLGPCLQASNFCRQPLSGLSAATCACASADTSIIGHGNSKSRWPMPSFHKRCATLLPASSNRTSKPPRRRQCRSPVASTVE